MLTKLKITLLLSVLIGAFSATVLASSHLPSPQPALAPPKSSMQPIDSIVAIVNDEIITASQLQTAIDNAKKQALGAGATLPNSKTLHKVILNQLIYQKLQLQLAKRNGVTVDEATTNKAIAGIARHNHTNVAALRSKLASRGYSFKQFKQQIKNQLIISKIQRQAIGPMIKIGEDDIQNYLKQYKQSSINTGKQYHVLDIVIADTSPAGLKIARQVLQKLNNKVSPASITHGKVSVNDMGWQSKSDLPDIFLTQINKISVNGLSQPIKAANGYHILKLLGTRTGGDLPSANQVRNVLFQQKFRAALIKWLNKLKSQSQVQIFDNGR
ncbi:MAG: SurA N-terminal domain-containing protein [Gammaproteobacteria bacterium]|nr:SurA N-terminal domain-containing protein [Gammaproteobacteria bacterium]